MAKRDYYQVLDLPRTATEADIKKAYRRLAMKHHPDRNPGDHEAESNFKEAKEAYEVLSDTQKRAAYDQFGHAGVDGMRGGGGGPGFDPRDAFGDVFGDVFGDIFGVGRRGRSQVYRGADLRYELELDLEQAVFGEHRVHDPCRVRGLQRQRGGEGLEAGGLRHLSRRGSGAHAAGFLHRAADLPALQRPRPDRERSLRQVPRPGTPAQAEDSVGQGSCRRGQW